MNGNPSTGRTWYDWVKAWRPGARKRPGRPRPCRLSLERMEERECPTTVQGFAAALRSQVQYDVVRFVRDAAVVETARPTLLARTVAQDLVRLAGDVRSGDTLQTFADFRTLGRHLAVEAVATAAYQLPARHALLAYSQIVSDLSAVARDKAVTFAFVSYVASHTRYHATGPTSSVFTSGLFGPGTIGGDTQAILAQRYQYSLTHYSQPTLSSYNHYFDSLRGRIDEKAKRLPVYHAVVAENWLLIVANRTKPSQLFDAGGSLNARAITTPFSRSFFYGYPEKSVIELGV